MANLLAIAERVAARQISNTKYSVQVNISISAEFEGNVSKPTLIKKIKSEVMASLEGAMNIVTRELRVQSNGVTIKPIKFDVKVQKD